MSAHKRARITQRYAQKHICTTAVHRMGTTALHLFKGNWMLQISIIEIQRHHFWVISSGHQFISVTWSRICWNLQDGSVRIGYSGMNASAGSPDPSGELCMQPEPCCLSVAKPVKGELIIPAGWFPEACVGKPGGHTPLPGFLMDTLITVEAD